MRDRAERTTVAVDLRALVGRPTGIGVFTFEILLELAQRDECRYLGMAHAATSCDLELTQAGIDVERHRAPLGVWWQQINLPRRISREDVDLLWSPLITLPASLSKPAVVTVHDLTTVLYPESHRFKVRVSILPFLTRTLDTARQIVVDSRATADDLRFHFPECAGRVRVVYPGVRRAFRPGSTELIETTRYEVGCPEGYILYVGTLEPRKNLPLVLDVWESMRKDDRSVPPLVLSGGSGWHSRGLLRRIESLEPEGLIYLGRTDRQFLVRLFQSASVFVYPSLYEGFGLPPLEAMACGIPTITSDRSSLREVAGEAAVKIDPEDPQALAQALRRILSEPQLAADLGSRGTERAASFSWARAAEEMETIFLESLDRPGS